MQHRKYQERKLNKTKGSNVDDFSSLMPSGGSLPGDVGIFEVCTKFVCLFVDQRRLELHSFCLGN